MAWATDRTGNPLKHVPAWGIDGYDDHIALRARLLREPFQPEWSLDYISPIRALRKPDYWAKPRAHLPAHQQRRIADGEKRRNDFLKALTQARTVKQAAEEVGVGIATVAAWRKRHYGFAERYRRIRAALPESDEVDTDFVTRRRYYFGYETYTHHQRMLDAIESTPDGGITLIVVAPEAGKTQLIQDWVCDKIATEPDVRITYVSESGELQSPAMKVLGAVKDRMTDPDSFDPDTQYPTHVAEWINRYGPFRDTTLDKAKPWNQKYIKVHKASARRDYTFQAVSWRARIYGSRCDWMIFDDVQSAEGLTLTPQIYDRCTKTFFNRPGRKGHIVFICTAVGVGDLREWLVEKIADRMIRVVAIPALDEDGNSYCPEMWPIEALEDKRALVGEEAWATSYMMAPQTAGVTTFSEEMLNEARDPTRIYGVRNPDLISLTLTGLDPALGGGNALLCAQTTQQRFNILAAQANYGLARNEDIYAIIRSFCRYHFTELVVERNSLQRGIARDDRLKDIAKIFGFKIVEHETGKNKWDFAFGVGAMAGSFIKGEITVPDGDKESRRLMEPWRTEFLAWRPNVDPKLLRQDLVMATWFTWMIWMQKRKRVGVNTEWKVGGTPWQPGDMSGQWGRRRYPVALP